MKLLNLLAIFFLVGAFSAAAAEKASPAADPVIAFLDEWQPERFFLIRRDFNNDGRKDIAVGGAEYFGNGGGPWQLYLAQAGGTYQLAKGELAFSPSGYRLVPAGAGKASLSGCWHMSAAECKPFEFIISGDSIASIPSPRLHKDEQGNIDFTGYDGAPTLMCVASEYKTEYQTKGADACKTF